MANKNNAAETSFTLSTLQLLSELNDPRLDLEAYEAHFLRGLRPIFQNEFAILLLINQEGGSRSKRKIFISGDSEPDEDEVKFDRGIIYQVYEKLEFLQFAGEAPAGLNPAIDIPPGISLTSYACKPLIYQNQLFGFLAIGNSALLPLDNLHQQTLFHLADSLAAHIYSVGLILELEESNTILTNSQQQLINSRNTLRTLFDNIPESFYVVDEGFTLTAVNRSRSDRAEAAPKELVGQKCYKALFKLSSPCPGCLVEATMNSNTPRVRRVHYLQKDQTNLEWEINTYPVPEVVGKPRQVILLEQNITEKRKLEAELIQSEKLAAVGQLAAGIAHDINNPLTSIIANAQILLADIPENEPELLQCAKLIELAGTKATQVVRNLLSSARKEEFEFALIDLNDTIQSALMLLSHEYISRDITILFNRSYDMPQIAASENHLQSVWMNLIMNAIEAIGNSNGKIEIVSKFDGTNFIVQIKDNGSGIPDKYIGQIFEPFFTTKHDEEGTGLGLTSVRRIVNAHHGEILVESEEGKGTTFTVVLPGEQE